MFPQITFSGPNFLKSVPTRRSARTVAGGKKGGVDTIQIQLIDKPIAPGNIAAKCRIAPCME